MSTQSKSQRSSQFQPAGQWIRTAKRAAIYERDGWACVYCGRGIRDARNYGQAQLLLSLDHLDCRSSGKQDNRAENLVTACTHCNCSRKDRPWREFATGGAQARIEWLIQQPLNLDLGKAIVASLNGSPDVERS